VPSNLWDKRKSRAKVIPAKADELNELNKHLDKLEQTVIDFLSLRHNSKTLSREDLKKHLKNSQKDERKEIEGQFQKENNFFSLWQDIINSTRGKSGEAITAGTKRSKEQTKDLVSKYALSKKIKLTFEIMDMDFYNKFDVFMQGTGLNANSRGKHFKEIKAIIREAQDRDIPVNLAYLKKSFKVIRKDSDSTYLSEEELKKILAINDLSKKKEVLRDIFIMACFVGARHSDWHQIRNENLTSENGKQLLKIKQQKTSDTVHIPLHPVVRSILNKYKDMAPKVISNQKFNDALKEICRAAKLGKCEIGGKLVDKADHISTHTARRSFATNAYLSRSLDVYQIMRCTGHKTESSFLKYLKLNGKDYATLAADSKFFNAEGWTMQKAS